MSYRNDSELTVLLKYGKAGSLAKAELFETYDRIRDLTISGPSVSGSGMGKFSSFIINIARMFGSSSFIPALGSESINIPGTTYYSPFSGGTGILPGGQAAFGLSPFSQTSGFPSVTNGGAAPLFGRYGGGGSPLWGMFGGMGAGMFNGINRLFGGTSGGSAAGLMAGGASGLSALGYNRAALAYGLQQQAQPFAALNMLGTGSPEIAALGMSGTGDWGWNDTSSFGAMSWDDVAESTTALANGTVAGGASFLGGAAAGAATAGGGALGTVAGAGYGRNWTMPAAGIMSGIGGILTTLGPFFGPFGLAAAAGGAVLNGFSGAMLSAYQTVSNRIINNADVILSDKVKNLETTIKQLDAQQAILQKLVKESAEGDKKALENL